MKATYDLVVSSIDNRGRVRFAPAELAEGAAEPNARVALVLIFEADAAHGYQPGQRVKLSVES